MRTMIALSVFPIGLAFQPRRVVSEGQGRAIGWEIWSPGEAVCPVLGPRSVTFMSLSRM